MTKPILSSTADPFLTTKEAAQRLGVTLRTVQLWVEAGKLAAGRTPGGHRRIRTSDVRALQEQMGIKPAKAVVVLTDDERRAVIARVFGDLAYAPQECLSLTRAIEAAVLAANGLEAPHA